jgi:hypothetical protein
MKCRKQRDRDAASNATGGIVNAIQSNKEHSNLRKEQNTMVLFMGGCVGVFGEQRNHGLK